MNARRRVWRVGPLGLYLGLGVLAGVAILLLILGQMALGLPGLHEPVVPRVGHYPSEARQTQAQQARAIIADPQNRCRFYECRQNRLRVCEGHVDVGELVHALQWLWFDDVSGHWMEGTVFLQDKPQKVDNYLRNNACREVTQ